MRMVLGVSTFIMWSWGVTVIPLSLCIIILYLQPFWTSLIAYKTHNEPIIRSEYIGMIICFLGVVGLTAGAPKVVSHHGEAAITTAKFTVGILILFLASVTQAGLQVTSRSVTSVYFAIITFHVSLLALLVALACIVYRIATTGEAFPTFSTTGFFYLLAGGLFDFISASSNTIAFQSDSAGFVSMVGYMAVVWAFILDFLVFSNLISGFQLICALVIFSTTITISAIKFKSNTE